MNFFAAHPLHPYLFLVGMAIFPRITMLFFVATPFAWFQWVGWVIAPHLMAAIWGTYLYWHTNPAICVVAWLVAFLGTSGEGSILNVKITRKEKYR